MVKPVLKWAGGKRQLLDELHARFPQDHNHYHEPFFGGGALFFDLEPANGSINDTNSRLVNFYKQVRDDPEGVINWLKSFEDPESNPDPEREFSDTDRKENEINNYYYQQRAIFNRRVHNESFDPKEEAALLLYLNRTGYNGLYRENSSGGFNVPIGRYSNPDWVQEQRIRSVSRIIEDTEIFNTDFEYIVEYAEPGDLVYFDPPYEPMSPTANFTDYSADGFGRDDQERLVEVAKEFDKAGVHIIISNSGVMFEMYDEAGFSVETEGATRAINSDGSSRGEVDEIIATNVPNAERKEAGQQTITDF